MSDYMDIVVRERQPANARLFHYTRMPLHSVSDSEQKPYGETSTAFDKPKGLWVSVEGHDGNGDEMHAWPQWCIMEDFDGSIKHNRYEITLQEETRVLWISDAGGILALTARYGLSRRLSNAPSMLYQEGGIDWAAVAEDFDGIIIAPYIWSLRLHRETSWYYGWDCASGCIWRARAIANVRQVESPYAPHKQLTAGESTHADDSIRQLQG